MDNFFEDPQYLDYAHAVQQLILSQSGRSNGTQKTGRGARRRSDASTVDDVIREAFEVAYDTIAWKSPPISDDESDINERADTDAYEGAEGAGDDFTREGAGDDFTREGAGDDFTREGAGDDFAWVNTETKMATPTILAEADVDYQKKQSDDFAEI